MTDHLLDALDAGIQTIDLGQRLYAGMPQSPHHPEYRLVLQRRHGDLMRADGSSGANELIVTGGHVGTHIDALSHISFDGRLHGGVDAREAEQGGRFRTHGIEQLEPLVCRGLLLDVPAALGVRRCDPASEITPEQLQSALDRTGTAPRRGDVLLIRTGWGALFDDRAAFQGAGTGTPGPGPDAARWLASHRPRAVGSDTIPFEWLPADPEPQGLPVHRILIVDEGIHLIEQLDLEGLADTAVTEFLFVLSPLKLVGATGSPARPIALISPATEM